MRHIKRVLSLLKGNDITSLISDEKYEIAKKKLEEIKTGIESRYELDEYGRYNSSVLPALAYIYQYSYQIANETNNNKDAIEIVKQGIELFSRHTNYFHYEEYLNVRNIIRKFYAILAWDAYETAVDDEGVLEAVNFINCCFDIQHFLYKDENAFDSYYELKALIYRRAKSIKKSYDKVYYKTLEEIIQNSISVQNEDIKCDINELKKDNPLDQLRFGAQGETFTEAVKRFEKAFNLTDNEKNSNYEPFNFKPPCSPEEFAEAEKRVGVELPLSLKNFYLNIAHSGGNQYNDHGFEIWAPNEICGYLDFVRCKWYYHKENSPSEIKAWYQQWYTEELSDSDMSYFDFTNDNYKVFGYYYFNADSICVLFYGKNGKMGVFDFAQDEWSGQLGVFIKNGFPLLKYNSFDELISRLFNIVIHVEQFEDEEWYAPSNDLIDRNKPQKG